MHGETTYGLEEAIEAIYKHQHPSDCSKAKYLINRAWEQGFGSELHVTGVGLATAMNLNRIYIMHPNQKYDSKYVQYYIIYKSALYGLIFMYDFYHMLLMVVQIIDVNRWQVDTPFCRKQGLSLIHI